MLEQQKGTGRENFEGKKLRGVQGKRACAWGRPCSFGGSTYILVGAEYDGKGEGRA